MSGNAADTTPVLNVRIVCAICDAPDPQVTHGCDKPECTWRAEAMMQVLREGGSLHAICDTTNNSAEDAAEGRLNVRIEAWPKEQGNA